MPINTLFETHAVALVLLAATTLFALIIITKIHAVRTDLDRALKFLPKDSADGNAIDFNGLTDQMDQMAVEIVALQAQGLSKAFVDNANASTQLATREKYTEVTPDYDNIEQAIKLLRQGLAVDVVSQRLNMNYEHVDLMSRFHGK
ncbi:MAG: hypothetical protein P8M25_20455 [Paracoccaceae bacterium]|nr:hypothetical protein [Paracoccaceae bacterium]